MRLKTFASWIENVDSPTVLYQGDAEMSDDGNHRTASIHHTQTAPATNPAGGTPRMVDPDISHAAQTLDQIHQNLRAIFARINSKTAAFRNKQVQAAFERELTQGIDSVSRSKMILFPNAKGMDDND